MRKSYTSFPQNTVFAQSHSDTVADISPSMLFSSPAILLFAVAHCTCGECNQNSPSSDYLSILSHIISLNCWVKAAQKEKPPVDDVAKRCIISDIPQCPALFLYNLTAISLFKAEVPNGMKFPHSTCRPPPFPLHGACLPSCGLSTYRVRSRLTATCFDVPEKKPGRTEPRRDSLQRATEGLSLAWACRLPRLLLETRGLGLAISTSFNKDAVGKGCIMYST